MAKKTPKTKYVPKKEYKPVDALIPSGVYYDKNLSDGAKVFYGVIISMSQKHECAFAGTYTFSKIIGRSTRSIQYYISELEERGLINLRFVGTKRELWPQVWPYDNSDQFIIPAEIVKSTTTSAAVKLSYGVIQYKSANKNGYFGFNNVQEIAKLIDKSLSTAYRHLKEFLRLGVAKLNKTDNQSKIYTFNSYQTKFYNKQTERIREANQVPPDKTASHNNDHNPQPFTKAVAKALMNLTKRSDINEDMICDTNLI